MSASSEKMTCPWQATAAHGQPSPAERGVLCDGVVPEADMSTSMKAEARASHAGGIVLMNTPRKGPVHQV